MLLGKGLKPSSPWQIYDPQIPNILKDAIPPGIAHKGKRRLDRAAMFLQHTLFAASAELQPNIDINTYLSHTLLLANRKQSCIGSPETFLCTKHIPLCHFRVQVVQFLCSATTVGKAV